jgi:transcriptional regulator with XRE-family HTH domain
LTYTVKADRVDYEEFTTMENPYTENRAAIGLTQKEMGIRVGFPEPTAESQWNKIENGKRKPNGQRSLLIEELLGITVSDQLRFYFSRNGKGQ